MSHDFFRGQNFPGTETTGGGVIVSISSTTMKLLRCCANSNFSYCIGLNAIVISLQNIARGSEHRAVMSVGVRCGLRFESLEGS